MYDNVRSSASRKAPLKLMEMLAVVVEKAEAGQAVFANDMHHIWQNCGVVSLNQPQKHHRIRCYAFMRTRYDEKSCTWRFAMARPIWNGVISFGLLNVPVSVVSGERKIDLHFRMLDARDEKPIRYERVNADTGEEVPWKDIVKAFEYDKGSYVVLDPEDIKSAAPEGHESVDIETFVDADAIPPQYYEKPYFLIPGKKAEKGYVLLRETLRKTRRMGIGRVVIRTREYLCAVFPQEDALVMNLLRYPQEVVNAEDFKFPETKPASARISKAELEMAEKLIESMSEEWQPDNFKDEFRERLSAVIQKRIKAKGGVTTVEETPEVAADATTNVVDFMALLRKSVASNKRTPAKKSASKKTTAKKPASKTSKREPAKKKAASKAKGSSKRKSA